MPISGRKNREVQGHSQVRDVRRESIVDYEVIATKLNPDVAGNGIALNPMTNAIDFTGYTIVTDTASLTSAIASGETNLYLAAGQYTLTELLIQSGSLQLTGESKTGVLIQLPPSGNVALSHVSGTILTGLASVNISNRGLVTITDGNVSGNAPLFSWQGAEIVIDDLPYRVNRISSGDISGTAIVELTDPWTDELGFTNKPFKMMYMIEDFSLRNLTIQSASDSGIININRANNVVFDNIAIKGANVLTRATSGIKLQYVYNSNFNAVEIVNTKDTLSLAGDRYGIEMNDVHYSNFYNIYHLNSDSNGILINNSTSIDFSNSEIINVNGVGFSILNSIVSINGNLLNNVINGVYIASGSIGSIVGDNYIVAETSALRIDGINNFLTDNIVISGSITVNSGNSFPVTTDLIPLKSGINIGAFSEPFHNIYSDNAIYLSGLPVTAFESGVLFVGGIRVSGLQGQEALFVFNQNTPLSTWNIHHGAQSKDFVITVYNGSGVVVSPTIDVIDYDNVSVLFGTPTTGKAVLAFTGGTSGVTFLPDTSSEFIFTQSTPATIWNINHNLNNLNYLIQTFDGSGSMFIPDAVNTIDANNVQIINAYPQSGTAIILANTAVIRPTQLVHVQSTPSTTWTISHNFDSTNFTITVFDSSGSVFLPGSIDAIDSGTIRITNSIPRTGKAVAVFETASVLGGPPRSGSIFVHTQSTPATIWNINHNQLSSVYSVTVFNSTGFVYNPTLIQTVDLNTVKITNSVPTAGTAVFVFPGPFLDSDQSQYIHTQSSAASTWNIPHGLASVDYNINVFSDSGELVYPDSVTTVDQNNIQVVNGSPSTGKAVILFKNADISGIPEKAQSARVVIAQEMFVAVSGGVNYGTGNTIPFDNTSPLFNEGHQILSGTITPLYTGSTIEIDSNIYASTSGNPANIIGSLFINPAPTDPSVSATALKMASNFSPVNLLMKHRYVAISGVPLNIVVRSGAETGNTDNFLLNYGGSGQPTLGNITSSWLLAREIRFF